MKVIVKVDNERERYLGLVFSGFFFFAKKEEKG